MTVSQYCNLENRDKYDFAIKYSKLFCSPVDEYGIGSLRMKGFGIVKDLLSGLEKGVSFTEMISFMCELTGRKTFGSEKLQKVTRFWNYIVKECESIADIEAKTLRIQPSAKMINAGIEMYSELGIVTQFCDLANDDPTKFAELRKTRYIDCYLVLRKKAIDAEFNKRLNKA